MFNIHDLTEMLFALKVIYTLYVYTNVRMNASEYMKTQGKFHKKDTVNQGLRWNIKKRYFLSSHKMPKALLRISGGIMINNTVWTFLKRKILNENVLYVFTLNIAHTNGWTCVQNVFSNGYYDYTIAQERSRLLTCTHEYRVRPNWSSGIENRPHSIMTIFLGQRYRPFPKKCIRLTRQSSVLSENVCFADMRLHRSVNLLKSRFRCDYVVESMHARTWSTERVFSRLITTLFGGTFWSNFPNPRVTWTVILFR